MYDTLPLTTRVLMSDGIENISKALVGAQADVGKALKNQENSHFKSQYADLSAVLEVSKPALAKHGLALTQFPGEAEGRVTMTTMLIHESGEWILLPPAAMPPPAQTAHGFGSAISYLRRYTTQAALGISVGLSDDDDGNAATLELEAPKKAPKKRVAPKKATPAFEPKKAKVDDPILLKSELSVLKKLIDAAEENGNVEAKAIDLAKNVLAKKGKLSDEERSPLDLTSAAIDYLESALKETPK